MDSGRFATSVRVERVAEYRTAAQRAEDATEKLLAKLSRLRPPAAARDVHAELLSGFQEYLEALRSFHAACRDPDSDAAARAAAGLAGAGDRLRSSERALRASVGYDERWPSLRATPSTR